MIPSSRMISRRWENMELNCCGILHIFYLFDSLTFPDEDYQLDTGTGSTLVMPLQMLLMMLQPDSEICRYGK